MPAQDENKDKPITRFEVVEESSTEPAVPVVPVPSVVTENPVAPSAVENLARIPQTTEVMQPVPQMPVSVESVERKGGAVVWLIVAFIVGAAVGVGGGFVLWNRNNKPAEVVETPSVVTGTPENTTEPTQTVAPAPTTAVKVDRGGVKIKILNGSGVTGAATKIKTKMEALGYKDIQTGNADKDTYVNTEVAVKTGEPGVADLVKADLKNLVSSLATDSSDVASSEVYDILVILGKPS